MAFGSGIVARVGGMGRFAIPRNADQIAKNIFQQRGREAMPRANSRALQVSEAFHVVHLPPDGYG